MQAQVLKMEDNSANLVALVLGHDAVVPLSGGRVLR